MLPKTASFEVRSKVVTLPEIVSIVPTLSKIVPIVAMIPLVFPIVVMAIMSSIVILRIPMTIRILPIAGEANWRDKE